MLEARDNSGWRLKVGFSLVAAGCIAPLAIPLVWGTTLSSGAKAAISAFLAFGLPELLVLAAIPVVGKRRLQYWLASLKRRVKSIWQSDRASRL